MSYSEYHLLNINYKIFATEKLCGDKRFSDFLKASYTCSK